MGKIKARWIDPQIKEEILMLVEQAQKKDIPVYRTCLWLGIDRRRVVAWRQKKEKGIGLQNGKPGPKKALHALLCEEEKELLLMAKADEYADLPHRALAIKGGEMSRFFLSFSSVYRVLRRANLMGPRPGARSANGKSIAPKRDKLTGANQRWCWDISYLPTHEKGLFLYLYLIVDEYSRKAIHWHISWSLSAEEAKILFEEAMIKENVLDLPENKRPEIINDRGTQMKAKSIKRLLEDHQMPQKFARPRTPNDNPYVEAAFSTIKRAHQYPGKFLDLERGKNYFSKYFDWYNSSHYHSGIEYVTPNQAHQGLIDEILAQRLIQQQQQCFRRREKNKPKEKKSEKTKQQKAQSTESCSVIS